MLFLTTQIGAMTEYWLQVPDVIYPDNTPLERAVRSMLTHSSLHTPVRYPSDICEMFESIPTQDQIIELWKKFSATMPQTDRIISANLASRENKIIDLQSIPNENTLNLYQDDEYIQFDLTGPKLEDELHIIHKPGDSHGVICDPFVTRSLFDKHGPFVVNFKYSIDVSIVHDPDVVAALLNIDNIIEIDILSRNIRMVLKRIEYLKTYHPELWVLLADRYHDFMRKVYYNCRERDLDLGLLSNCLNVLDDPELRMYLQQYGNVPLDRRVGCLAYFRVKQWKPVPLNTRIMGIPDMCEVSEEELQDLLLLAVTDMDCYMKRLSELNQAHLEYAHACSRFIRGYAETKNEECLCLQKVCKYNPMSVAYYIDIRGRVYQFTDAEYKYIQQHKLNPYNQQPLSESVINNIGEQLPSADFDLNSTTVKHKLLEFLGYKDWDETDPDEDIGYVYESYLRGCMDDYNAERLPPIKTKNNLDIEIVFEKCINHSGCATVTLNTQIFEQFKRQILHFPVQSAINNVANGVNWMLKDMWPKLNTNILSTCSLEKRTIDRFVNPQAQRYKYSVDYDIGTVPLFNAIDQ